MRKFTNLIAVCFLIFSTGLSCSAQKIHTKGSLFIIGGGPRPLEMMKRIATESGIDKGGYGVILPMSSAEPDSAIFYTGRSFSKVGFNNVYGLQFKKGEYPNRAKLDSIRNARLVYISGGDQSKFMAVVGGTEIEKAIHEAFAKGSMVAGTSAGAAVMSQVMITGNELKYSDYHSTFRNIEAENIETATGLGMLTSAIIDQHFVYRSRHNRLISAVIEYPNLLSIGIDESTAILVKGSMAEVVGLSQVMVYSNPQSSKEIRNGKLGAKGLKLDIYLPGDRFRIE